MKRNVICRLQKRLSERKSLSLIILFLVFTICIYAPYEMYLTNRQELWFRVIDFWWIPVVCGLFVMLMVLLLGMFLKGRILQIYEGILFGLALVFYIQGNFLNLRIGVLNGAAVVWEEYSQRFFVDSMILCAIVVTMLAIALLKYKLFKKLASIVSAFFTATQVVALIVMLVPAITEAEPQEEPGFLSNKGLYEVAKDENTVVFLLDMFDDTYFKQIMSDEPEIINQLEGFTYFSNSTGGYSTTAYSLMHLMSGDYFHNEISRYDWVDERSKERLWLDELTEKGYKLNIYSYDEWIPTRLIEEADNYVSSSLGISEYGGFTKDLYQFVMCKYFPDILKPYIWMDGTELNQWKKASSEYQAYSTNNVSFRDGIIQDGISIGDIEKQFKFIHIDGSHYPYYIDENGDQVEPDSVPAISCARGALRLVQDYMNGMKENGTYENASIFIIADHGYYWDGVLTNPIMLVKPKGSMGKLTISNAPVSQKEFPPTVLALAGLNEDHAYGKSVFEIQEGEERERIFYQYNLQEGGLVNGNYRLIEYRVDSSSNDRDSFHLTDVEYSIYGEKSEHIKYCKTCQEGKLADDNEPPRVVHVRE